MFLNHGDNATDLVRAEAPDARDLDRVEPDLDRRLAPVDVDVRRLVRFVAEEVEPEPAQPQHGGQGAYSAAGM